MIVALGAAIGIGLAVKQANPSRTLIQILAFPGELLMRLLYLMILPLISVSLIASKQIKYTV
jgi:Na+/H+-dicarboxylate symporter